MSTYRDRVHTPRVTLPRKYRVTKREQKLFRKDHPLVIEHVEAGAKLLDRFASDWYLRVDLDTLVISGARRGILEQVFGDYRRGLQKLNLYWGDAHGFSCYEYENERYKKAWAIEIQKRL